MPLIVPCVAQYGCPEHDIKLFIDLGPVDFPPAFLLCEKYHAGFLFWLEAGELLSKKPRKLGGPFPGNVAMATENEI